MRKDKKNIINVKKWRKEEDELMEKGIEKSEYLKEKRENERDKEMNRRKNNVKE